MNLDYAGDLSPRETWDKIKENVDCFLVDCRTSAEWSLIGVPDLDSLGKKVIFIESRSAAEFLTSQGYESCFNCSEGFEGVHDNFGHRSKVNGWKFHNLSWKQG